MAHKVAEYLAAESQRVWVVYPAGRRVVIHRADGSVLSYDVITEEELLPGLSPNKGMFFRSVLFISISSVDPLGDFQT